MRSSGGRDTQESGQLTEAGGTRIDAAIAYVDDLAVGVGKAGQSRTQRVRDSCAIAHGSRSLLQWLAVAPWLIASTAVRRLSAPNGEPPVGSSLP